MYFVHKQLGKSPRNISLHKIAFKMKLFEMTVWWEIGLDNEDSEKKTN